MAEYTLGMWEIYQDKNFNLFDLPYNLYDNDLKPYFEEKFYQHFMFKEIGVVPLGRFKQMLIAKLNDIYPYYKEIYKSVLVAENMDFMTTKELKEVFTREVEGNSTGNVTSSSESNSNNNTTDLTVVNDTPQNKIDDLDEYITSASKNDGNSNSNSSSTGKSQSSSNNKMLEKTTFESVGNLGVSSDGFLLEKWREVTINIDQMIFDELNSLFLQVY